MAERRDYVAMDWVLGEIAVTMKQACQALEAYVSDPADSTRLRFCLSYAHQIQGTLRMLEFHGAALFAREMELLAKALVDDDLKNSAEGVDALSAGLLQLPSYLEHARVARRDIPSVLLPMVNELRAVRGDSLLSESVLFAPRMAAAKPLLQPQPEISEDDFSKLVQNLRQMFQVAFVGIIRNRQLGQNLDYLAKVCQRLYALSHGKAREPLWNVTLGVIEGLTNKSIEPNMAVKSLLKEIDSELKCLLREGASYLDQVPAEELMKNLLYYVARSDSESPLIAGIQQDYQLKEALAHSSSDDSGVADAEAMRSVVEALVAELGGVKELLDIYARGSGDGSKTLEQCLPILKRVGDTMAVLGLSDSLSQVRSQAEVLEWVIGEADSAFASSALLDVASNLIEIEQSLQLSVSRSADGTQQQTPPHLDEARKTVAREARIVLEQIKESIIEFVASQWNHSTLDAAPDLLSVTRGSLFMVDFVSAAQILWACERYMVETLLQQQTIPEWRILDTLADALSSVDYYLERYLEDSQGSHESILDAVVSTVVELGFPLEEFDAQNLSLANVSSTNHGRATPVVRESAAVPVLQLVSATGDPELLSGQEEAASSPAVDATSVTVEAPVDEALLEASAPEVGGAPLTSTALMAVPLEPVVEEALDPDIAEIFVEEATEVVETITHVLPKWRADNGDSEALAELRRAWHTLKGSGRMVGACVVGELAWSIESLLNKIVEGVIPAVEARVTLVEQVTELVPGMVAAFEHGQAVNKAYVEEVIAIAQRFAEPAAELSLPLGAIVPDWIDPQRLGAARDAAVLSDSSGSARAGGDKNAAVNDASASAPQSAAALRVPERSAVSPEAPASLAEIPVDEVAEDLELWGIFRAEATMHLSVLDAFIEQTMLSAMSVPVSDELQRALHTLKGSANMAGQMTLAGIVTPLEKLVKSLQVGSSPVGPEVLSVLSLSAQRFKEMLGCGPDSGQSEQQTHEYSELLEQIEVLSQVHGTVLADESREERVLLEAVGQFMLEAADQLQEMTQVLGQKEAPCGGNITGDITGDIKGEAKCGLSATESVLQHCGYIAREARSLGLDGIVQLAQACADAAERVYPDSLSNKAIELVQSACCHLEGMLDCLAADQALQPVDPALLEALAAQPQAATQNISAAQADSIEPVYAATEAIDDLEVTTDDLEATIDDPEATTNDPTGDGADPLVVMGAEGLESEPVGEVIDAEILEIFVEEAHELLESLDDTIHRWQLDRDEPSFLDLLQRQLHTLKGSARLAGLSRLGDMSHDFETFVSDVAHRGAPFDSAFFAQVQRYQDGVNAQVEQLFGPGTEVLVDVNAQPREAEFEALTAASSIDSADEPLIDIDLTSEGSAAPVQAPANARQEQQAVKVPAQLIEDLVNLAGETSINRGRVDEQINEVIYSLAEMDSTIDRMQEQLRRLDRETEAQLMFRQEQVESLGLEEFDPLEMDRYSVLQQLSRSLMESSYDVQEVKRSIFNKARDVETLLAQQSRINTDLQEGLMRSRMVPFMRMVPRLRRIVRQVSRELDKEVSLVVNNADGEMDRTILERMVPPFEHMLRNAVDHGIETRQARQALGKPDEALIAISFEREAGDIVITLSDDGRGINLDAVKAKAIERGLVSGDARLTDHEILQFILQPGFSTAQAVTQISGRGVGMDVVASEIKQLGGSVRIESTLGHGTHFIIRLPFTVSVNRALMVRICGESYALPLNTIEGIVRVSPFELESYYQPEAPSFEYAGQAYKLRYMGAMIERRSCPDLRNETSPLPVILVRSGDHSVAVQVDALLGSREIVVKTLGPQFNVVQGLSGATVLGDGGVVVILDLHAMIRSDVTIYQRYDEENSQSTAEPTQEQRNRLVMVVDDSVTVRKVTSRFLERNGMDVLLATDGVDAMRLLQEHTPDVMLLDIEMPRMDGFEVASRIKHSSRLEHLPIIMITSRTGQKHRERAEAIGVDRYLGKPYQEIELLHNINDLTGMMHQSLS
jgi:chemosensory pili system protein ChpA (sensor histidine kinase/response regulator)